MREIVLVGLVVACSGCSKGHEAYQPANSSITASDASHQAVPETLRTSQGATYKIDRVSSIKSANLPSNSDMKMADNDIAKYAETLCILDGPVSTAPSRCDVYVQSDKGGTLLGYAAIVQDSQGVSLQTATTLNPAKAGTDQGCALSGKLYADNKPVRDASKDFDGQYEYSAWEKEPGDWVVAEQAPDAPSDDSPNAALGVWYVAKKGDKLHINQERWNYCYPAASKVYVDDVFYRAATLVRT